MPMRQSQLVQHLEPEEECGLVQMRSSTPNFISVAHKEKAAEETSAAFFAVFHASPEISRAKQGNFGVPTGIRTPVLTVKG